MITPYNLIRSARKSLSIQIDPSGNLIARAPMRMPIASIERWITAKKDWIIKHQIKRSNTPQRAILSELDIRDVKKKLLEYIIVRVEKLWE